MICRILRIIIRKNGTLHQLEMVKRIHNGRVDAALVGAFVMHPTVIMLLQRGLLKEGAQHIFILHLTHAQDAQRFVFRHGQNGLVHVVAFAVETALRPVLHAVFSEGIIGLGAVHKRVEEIFHVPEGNANRLALS